MERLSSFNAVTKFSQGVHDHAGNEMDAFFESFNISRPAVPGHLRGQLNKVSGAQHIWSSRSRDADKDPRGTFDSCLREAVNTHGEDSYVLFGVSEEKYYFYFHVDGPLAVFYLNNIEHSQGADAKHQNESARGSIDAFQSTVATMQGKLNKAQENGLELPGKRLLIVCRDYDEGMPGVRKAFVWLKEGDTDFTEVSKRLKTGRMFLGDALRSIPKPLGTREVSSQ